MPLKDIEKEKRNRAYQKISFQNAFAVGKIINAAIFDLIQ